MVLGALFGYPAKMAASLTKNGGSGLRWMAGAWRRQKTVLLSLCADTTAKRRPIVQSLPRCCE
jgi:hypothetical protein